MYKRQAQTYPQPIAPAPPRDRRPDFSGMPSGAFSYSDGKASPWMNPDPVTGANGASPYGAKESPRTQVVGSQGRRGILPSVPGRATPVTNGVNGTAKSTTIPAKDADGKFPCPHCNKTYLHAKHLKRHLLRREYHSSRSLPPSLDPLIPHQIPEIARTCVCCARILSPGVIS